MELSTEATELIDQTMGFVIEAPKIMTPTEFVSMAEGLKAVKTKLDLLEQERQKIASPLYRSMKAINELFKKASDHLIDQETTAKRAIKLYNDEQERRRREAQQKLDDEARREQARLRERAQKAEASGKVEKAAQLENQAAAVTAPVVSAPVVKVEGVTSRAVWSFRIIDAALVPREYLIVNEAAIRGVVKALKGATRIAGVEVYPDTTIAVRGS